MNGAFQLQLIKCDRRHHHHPTAEIANTTYTKGYFISTLLMWEMRCHSTQGTRVFTAAHGQLIQLQPALEPIIIPFHCLIKPFF